MVLTSFYKFLNDHEKYLHFIAPNIFKSYEDQRTDDFNQFFCPAGDNSVLFPRKN